MAVQYQRAPVLPPPRLESGPVAWIRDNLFSTWYNAVLTIVLGILGVLGIWFGLAWVFGEADWQVIPTLGGRFLIGQYNVEGSCPGQNCFWRPQAALLIVTVLLGMAWAVAGGGVARRIAILVAAITTLSAFLPYSMEDLGLDARVLLLANTPSHAGRVRPRPPTPPWDRCGGLRFWESADSRSRWCCWEGCPEFLYSSRCL